MSDAVILRWPKHVRRACRDDCEGCFICNGGLFQCIVCGGAEGDLSTECPGERTSLAQRDAIMSGAIDFIKGTWISL